MQKAWNLVLALEIPANTLMIKNSKQINLQRPIRIVIIYNLVNNYSYKGKGGPYYILQRTGPSLNEKGYYEINNVKTIDVLDKVKNKFDDNVICDKKSIKKEVKGIVLCIDEKGREQKFY